MAPFADVPDFVLYAEKMKSKLDKKKITLYIDMIAAVRAKYPTLTWSQADMISITKSVAEIQVSTSKWQRALTDTELADYSSRVGKRLRALFFHVRQAEIKKTKWLLKLLPTGSDETEDADDAAEEAEEDDAEEKEKDASKGPSRLYGPGRSSRYKDIYPPDRSRATAAYHV